MSRREKYLLGILVFVIVGSAGLVKAANPAVPANGIDFTRLAADVCPSGNHTCVRADNTGNLIEKRTDLTGYLVAASPAPSAGQYLSYNASGMWTPGSLPAATIAIGSAITSGTSGSVLFVDGSANLAQNNSGFSWSDSNRTLTLATNDSTSTKYSLILDNIHASAIGSGIELAVTNVIQGHLIAADTAAAGLVVGLNVDVPSGKSIGMRVNAANVGTWSATGLVVASGLGLDTPDIGNSGSTMTVSDTANIAANKNLTCSAGTTALDLSLGTGVTKTTTGANTLGGDTSLASGKKLTVNGSKFASTGTAPTCTVQAAAGTTATCNGIVGNDSFFKFVVTAGGTGGAAGAWAFINFNGTWSNKPVCTVSLGSLSSTAPTKLYTFYYDYANSSTTVGKFGLDYGTDFLPPATTLIVHCVDPGA